MQELIFVTLPHDGQDVHIRVDSILTLRPMDTEGKAFLGLANGQFEVVDMTPDEVIAKIVHVVDGGPF